MAELAVTVWWGVAILVGALICIYLALLILGVIMDFLG